MCWRFTLTEDLPCKIVTNSAWSLGEHNPPKVLCLNLPCGIPRVWFKLLATVPMRRDLFWSWEPLISSLCVEIKWKFVKNEGLVALRTKIFSIYQKAGVQH